VNVSSTNDTNRLIKKFASIKASKAQLRLNPGKQPSIAFTRISQAASGPVVFSLGSQAVIDKWFQRLPEAEPGVRKFGVHRYAEPPAARPPTLTVYVGHEAIDLRRLDVPVAVEVVADVTAAERAKLKDEPGLLAIDGFVAEPYVKAITTTVACARAAAMTDFGFDPPAEVRVSATMDASRAPRLWTDGQGNLVASAIIQVTSTAPAVVLPRIRINEWMASNGQTIADPADLPNLLYEDWFELYNEGDTTVDLSGYTLSDTRANLGRSVIPNGTTVAPGGFLLVWADEEPWQDAPGRSLHANFKLDVDGDDIFLADPDGRIVDEVVFGQQTRDVSQGRWPDGYRDLFHFMTSPTPGGSNRCDPAEAMRLVVSSIAQGRVALAWNTEPGKVYRVLFNEDLTEPVWQELDRPTATGFTTSLTDSAAPGRQRFYRVMRQ
jgi:hypothetical protein